MSNLIIVLIGILFYVALSNFGVIRQYIRSFLDVLRPFLIGLAIAYLLNNPVSFFERKVYRRLKWKRGLSIATVYLLALVVAVILLDLILPQVGSSVMTLISNIQVYLNNLNDLVDVFVERFDIEWEGLDNLIVSFEELINRLAGTVSEALPQLVNFGKAVGNGVVAAITALISSIYMLSGKHKLTAQVKRLLFALCPTEKVEKFLRVCSRANEIFSGFIDGKLIDSAIIGVLCFVLCCILRVPYAPLLGVVIGVTNVIPFFGPLIGGIPSVLFLIVIDPWAALRFGIMIVVLQQFDGNILGPKILGNSTGLSAIWVLVAIVVGGGLFGFPGMILGVPTFAVLYMLTREFVNTRLAAKQIDGEGRPLTPSGEVHAPPFSGVSGEGRETQDEK